MSPARDQTTLVHHGQALAHVDIDLRVTKGPGVSTPAQLSTPYAEANRIKLRSPSSSLFAGRRPLVLAGFGRDKA